MMPFTFFPYLHAKTANSLCPLCIQLPTRPFGFIFTDSGGGGGVGLVQFGDKQL